MITVLSLVTSVKDYIEIAHKLIETQAPLGAWQNPNVSSFLGIRDYTELGAVCTFIVLSFKEFLTSFFSFAWLSQIWSLPLIVPDIASAMISEVSVLDSYFTNAFSFLETGVSTSFANGTAVSENTFIYGFEKFITGFLNSFFLFLPTSTSHLIILRRFVMQGLEAGYIAGLGTIAGNFLWLTSIIFGWRFIVIPWLSFDIFRYILGFILLVKYLWDSSKEPNLTSNNNRPSASGLVSVLEDNTKKNIFLLNFLLALTEQTSIYPFISNISFGAEGSILESFSGPIFESQNAFGFIGIHALYLFGILLGCISLLNFTVWFWENPAFSIYMWMISSYRITTSSYYKVLNFIFLYLTMLCAISSIPYFGFDYTITNPLGLIPQDKIIDQKSLDPNNSNDKLLSETAFLGVKPTDKNSRIRDGVHARRERWKERLIKYQAYDASLYDQGVYDILTLEDLNYGFDRFWLRRKMRNHQIRFRLFPGPWMRSVKKQLNKPGFTGPRVEFFRILFEQYYHPSFHSQALRPATFSGSGKAWTTTNLPKAANQKNNFKTPNLAVGQEHNAALLGGEALRAKSPYFKAQKTSLLLVPSNTKKQQKNLIKSEYSALRKFSRNVNSRINSSPLLSQDNVKPFGLGLQKNVSKAQAIVDTVNKQNIYSKSLKSLFNKIAFDGATTPTKNVFRNISRNLLTATPQSLKLSASGSNYAWTTNLPYLENISKGKEFSLQESFKKTNIRKKLSKKERLLLSYKTELYYSNSNSPAVKQVDSTLSAEQDRVDQAQTAWPTNPLGNKIPASLASKRGLQKNKDLGIKVPSQTAIVQPLNFYLKKEDSFRRKLKYYNTTVVRKLSVGNNAPYFKTMLKKYFYYYKPSLRYKRTMFTAAMRRGLRKKTTLPKKLVYNTTTLTSQAQGVGVDSTQNNTALFASQRGPETYSSTKSYSVLGKRASRYRYQIYKDVLQHWYYTPFNRLLLKFDIDSFINRQPKTHFLTKKEERLLHLRRLLLSDHYNTLRWYTSMQHYRTMKSRIGGTKSFSSTVYNQQFQGTFKKIRHLFSITPSQGEMAILKFDQPLFKENLKAIQNQPASSTPSPYLAYSRRPTYIHEDQDSISFNSSAKAILAKGPNTSGGTDLIQDSLQLTGEYYKNEQTKKQIKIKQYIIEKNYTELTKLLANNNKVSQDSKESWVFENSASPEKVGQASLDASQQNTKNLLVKLLKECQRRLNDQTFLKNYINHRIDKREQRFKEAQNEFRKNLDSLKTWLSPVAVSASDLPRGGKAGGQLLDAQASLDNTATTGTTKALKDGVMVLYKVDPGLSRKPLINKLISNKWQEVPASTKGGWAGISVLKNLQREEQITQTIKSIQILTTKSSPVDRKIKSVRKTTTQAPLEAWSTSTKVLKKVKQQKTIIQQFLKPILFMQNKIFTKRAEKNIEWWRQKQRVMKKRKVSRKKKRLTKIQKVYEERNKVANIGQSSQALTPNSYFQQLSQESVPFTSTNSLTIRNLRKKLDSQESLALNNSNRDGQAPYGPKAHKKKKTKTGNFKLMLQTLFLKKFNKNKTSKGRRIRTLLGNRGFAFVRKPKNSSYFSLSNIHSHLTAGPTREGLEPIGLNTSLDSAAPILTSDRQFEKNGNIIKAQDYSNKQSYFFLSKIDQRNLLKELKAKMQQKQSSDQEKTSSLAENLKASSKTEVGQAPKGVWSTTKKRNLINLLVKESLKKSPVKKRSKRSFRKSRNQFARNHSKYRKRSNHGIIKLRGLNKKLKRIEAIQDLQNWWWHTYLPNYIQKNQATKGNLSSSFGLANDKTPGLQRDAIAFKPLSTKEALEIRYKKQLGNTSNLLNLKTGTVQPQAELTSPYPPSGGKGLDNSVKESPSALSAGEFYPAFDVGEARRSSGEKAGLLAKPSLSNSQAQSIGFIDKIYENLFISPEQTNTNTVASLASKRDLQNTANIPFYAGWDDSLRKFVVTNRLLSRRDAGFIFNLDSNSNPSISATGPLKTEVGVKSTLPFTKNPIQGLNEASFLYLQNEMPFNAYIIDQFMPNNQSFYAPLGWKRFQFRHSLLKNWINFSHEAPGTTASNVGQASLGPWSRLLLNKNSITNFEYFNDSSTRVNGSQAETSSMGLAFTSKKATLALQNRRIKKRYKLLKQTPINLMYVPTGALLNEVLPSHYISIFDKQTRFPRNRYLKRFLPSDMSKVDNKKEATFKKTRDSALLDLSNSLSVLNTSRYNTAYEKNASANISFTLRKRIKPRRKYHQKRFTKKDGLIFPRRRKFGSYSKSLSNLQVPGLDNTFQGQRVSLSASGAGEALPAMDFFRLRPSSQAKQLSNQSAISSDGRNKTKKRVPKTNPMRLRQLRRREFQQVYKPLQRFEPRNGGFVWSGDYLRLQTIPMSKLDSLKAVAITNAYLVGNSISAKDPIDGDNKQNPQASAGMQNKIKNKINIQPIGLLPRKYLLEKHNLKVLKKKASIASRQAGPY